MSTTLSFTNLLLAFVKRQISLPIMILTMRKYPSLKNCYKYLLKSAIHKSAGRVHHCKSQKKGGESPKQVNNNKKPPKKYRQNMKKRKKKKVCWGMGPNRWGNRKSKLELYPDVAVLSECRRQWGERGRCPGLRVSCHFNIGDGIGEVTKISYRRQDAGGV